MERVDSSQIHCCRVGCRPGGASNTPECWTFLAPPPQSVSACSLWRPGLSDRGYPSNSLRYHGARLSLKFRRNETRPAPRGKGEPMRESGGGGRMISSRRPSSDRMTLEGGMIRRIRSRRCWHYPYQSERSAKHRSADLIGQPQLVEGLALAPAPHLALGFAPAPDQLTIGSSLITEPAAG